jgi:hypothetical protein
MFSWHKLSWFTLIIILCLYLFFPSGFSANDGWYYAASIKYGSEIFQPHHLLYNAIGLVFSWLPSKAGFEIISCLKALNAFFAFLALVVIQHILYYFKLTDKQVVLTTCLVGLSFSVLRYATENETYIVPLFFALLASFNYLKYITDGRRTHALYSGLWAAVSVLFHQIYIFWWFGLLIGVIIEKRKKPALLYLIISMIGPLCYILVYLTYKGTADWHTLTDFILGDFRGNARLGLSLKGIFLSLINLIRSFIQVHGYIFNLVRESLLFAIPGIVSLFFVFFAFLNFPERSKTNMSHQFYTIHILILVFQFVFAVFSFGNAEFMMMVPALVFLLVPFFALNYEKFLLRILIAMAVWNISYGLIPLHSKSQVQEQFLCEAELTKRNIIIVASDDQLIKNMLFYKTGNNNMKNIYKSPAVLKINGKDPRILETVIDSALSAGTEIYTNCLDEEAMSRFSIMEGTGNKDFFRNYETILIKSWKLITGTRSVFMVKRKLKNR